MRALVLPLLPLVKCSLDELKELLHAYAVPGQTARIGGNKDERLEILAEVVRASSGFGRAPRFDAGAGGKLVIVAPEQSEADARAAVSGEGGSSEGDA